VAKVPKIHDDTFSSLLDRIGILREELVSIEPILKEAKAEYAKLQQRAVPRLTDVITTSASQRPE
jgi:hypothetical protein